MKAKTALLAAGLLIALGAVRPGPTDEAFHFALRESAPEAGASVSALEEVRLWFTEAPAANSVGIRLIDAAGEAVDTGEPTADEQDARSVGVPVAEHLASGAYTVSWRGIGDDGHVVRGDFEFTVSAQQ